MNVQYNFFNEFVARYKQQNCIKCKFNIKFGCNKSNFKRYQQHPYGIPVYYYCQNFNKKYATSDIK